MSRLAKSFFANKLDDRAFEIYCLLKMAKSGFQFDDRQLCPLLRRQFPEWVSPQIEMSEGQGIQEEESRFRELQQMLSGHHSCYLKRIEIESASLTILSTT